ncbi:hypothetical protein, partial [Klebsiella variicola]
IGESPRTINHELQEVNGKPAKSRQITEQSALTSYNNLTTIASLLGSNHDALITAALHEV